MINDKELNKLSEAVGKLNVLRDKANLKLVKRIVNSFEAHCPDISIETIEEVLKIYKDKERVLSRETVPGIMNENNLETLKLKSGEQCTARYEIKASISNKNYLRAYRNMISQRKKETGKSLKECEKEIDDLFKDSLIIKEDLSENLFDYLIDHGIPYDTKKEIHWATLKKYCKELLERGQRIPEGINVFQYQETILK